MTIERFEDIVAWQKAKILTILVYKKFQHCRDFNFCNQIQRAVVSIMNNIAEGFERRGDKELRNFLYIAKGSCGEVRSMLLLASELQYVSDVDCNAMSTLAQEVSRLLSGFIKTLQ